MRMEPWEKAHEAAHRHEGRVRGSIPQQGGKWRAGQAVASLHSRLRQTPLKPLNSTSFCFQRTYSESTATTSKFPRNWKIMQTPNDRTNFDLFYLILIMTWTHNSAVGNSAGWNNFGSYGRQPHSQRSQHTAMTIHPHCPGTCCITVIS
jgi:hypothetical protein